MEQDNNKDIILRPSWKGYMLQYWIIFALAVVVFTIAFSNITGRWRDVLYIAGTLSIVLTVIRILLGRFENKTAWKNYIFQYLLIFAVVLIIGIIVFSNLNATWQRYLCIIGKICILSVVLEILFCRFSERFILKQDRVSMEIGLIGKNFTGMEISKIRTVVVKQDLWQRIFNIGNVHVLSSALNIAEITAHGINNPHDIKDRILSQQSRMQQPIVITTPSEPEKTEAEKVETEKTEAE